MLSASSSLSTPLSHKPSESVSVGLLVATVVLEPQVVSWASLKPSLSSSVSPALQIPSASVSVPSFLMATLEPAAKLLDGLAEQSSQVSPSESLHLDGSNGNVSKVSSTPSLSSSSSQTLPPSFVLSVLS